MSRKILRLTTRRVATECKPGRHADGNGLYLVVDRSGAKRWTFLFRDRRTGKTREMGLGGIKNVTLADARQKAGAARAAIEAEQDPIEARKTSSPQCPKFLDFAIEYVDSMKPSWRNRKHMAQWEMTLRVYCAPLSEIPISDINTEDILRVLRPIWSRIPETAGRIRGRIEAILDSAKAKGYRSGENPARWRGHLCHILPPARKLVRGHHKAMPYKEVPLFIKRLKRRDCLTSRALEFLILTACRTSEVLLMTWQELDLQECVWTIPDHRTKSGREHRVPLCDRAVQILKEMELARSTRFVFPGMNPGKPLSQMSLLTLLRRMNVDGATTHGFRSSFRDWCGECTSFPREVAEAALAHSIGNKAEAAYRRGDALEKRRILMAQWSLYCSAKKEKDVVSNSGLSDQTWFDIR